MLKFGVCKINYAIFSVLFLRKQRTYTFKSSLRKFLVYFSITGCELKHNVSAYYGNNGFGVFKLAAQY